MERDELRAIQALVACAGVTLRAVATSLGISIEGGSVHAEGDLDFRGTLALGREAPVGFQVDPPRLRVGRPTPKKRNWRRC